jgi:hypothetical protein
MTSIELFREQVLLEELEGQQRTKDDFMPLEQASIHPLEYGYADHDNEHSTSLSGVFARLSPLDSLVEERDKRIE